MKLKSILKKVSAAVVGCALMLTNLPVAFANEGDVLLHYDFESEITQGVNYGAVIKEGYAYFDGVDDYIHMPDNLVSGEEKVTFLINVRPEMDGANQFTFTVGTNEGNYLFLNTNNGSNLRFAMTNVGWWSEESEMKTDPVQKGQFKSIAVVMDGKSKKMYVDGEIVSETTGELLASSLGDTNQNYLAKSQYSGDAYFKGYIEDFKVYAKALSSDEIKNAAKEHKTAAEKANVSIIADTFAFEKYEVSEDIHLPSEYNGVNIEWKSYDESVITKDGVITRYDINRTVELKATFSDDAGNTAERKYSITVLKNYTDKDYAQMDLDEIVLVGNLMHLKEDLYLPTESTHGSTIRWSSSNENIITSQGEITRLLSGGGSQSASLTVFSTYGSETVWKKYDVCVEERDFAYLFAYFTGNSAWQEKVYYGLSRDGYHFNTINNGNPVLESTKGHKGVRDPFIMQGQNGKYYLLLTDMRSSEGWRSQSSIIIFESEDLVNWDEGTIIDFNQFGWFNTAWAPQAIWDPEFYDEESGEYGAYMIYLALCTGGMPQMYKVYSKDMKTLITKPEILYKRADDLGDIDSDIIYKDGLYYMYVKDESAGGVYVVTSKHAGGPYSERINALPAKDKNGNNVAIEGSAIYKVMNTDKYNLVYDAYMSNFFVMTETEDLVNFTQLPRNEYSFNFTPRHGYVIPISKAEVDNLQEAYGRAVPDDREAKKDPILYYDFEDEEDKSGNFYSAQLSSSAAFAQGALGGKALELTGNSESFVTIPSEAMVGLSDYTVSAWIKTDVTDNTQRVFDFGTDNQRYMFLTPYYSQGVVRGAITAGSHEYEQGISVEKAVPTGTWTHIVMMSEGETMRLYIDSILVGEVENVHLDPYEIAYTIPYCYIGKSMWSGDRYFNGMIDEFRIYDRAITDEEVIELYELDAPKDYYVEATEGKFVFNCKNVPQNCVAVIAQYDNEGILVKAEKIPLSENADIRYETDKTGSVCKAFVFESMESIKPIN